MEVVDVEQGIGKLGEEVKDRVLRDCCDVFSPKCRMILRRSDVLDVLFAIFTSSGCSGCTPRPRTMFDASVRFDDVDVLCVYMCLNV